jgi:hypothetical protein
MLTRIKTYIRERGQVSLRDLCLRFDSSPEAMRDMLSIWIRKGQVIPPADDNRNGADCGSCNACHGPGLEAEMYSWRSGSLRPADNARTRQRRFFHA